MAAACMLKKVVHPFFLHQPTRKAKERFPVLHAVVPRADVVDSIQAEIRKARIVKNLRKDVSRRHRLKNLRVGCFVQEQQPRHRRQTVATRCSHRSDSLKAAHQTVERSLGAVRKRHGDGHRLTKELRKIDVERRAFQFEDHFKWPAEFLAIGKSLQRKRIASQRRLERHALGRKFAIACGRAHERACLDGAKEMLAPKKDGNTKNTASDARSASVWCFSRRGCLKPS